MLSVWYTIEFTKMYIVAFHILNLVKAKSIIKCNIAVVLLLLAIDTWLFINHGQITEYHFNPFVFMGLAFLVMTYATGKFKLLPLVVGVHVFVHFVDLLIAGTIVAITPITIAEVMATPVITMMVAACSVLLFGVVGLIMKRLQVDFRISSLDKKDMVLFVLGLATFGFSVTVLQMRGDGSVAYNQLFLILANISGLVLLGIALVFIRKANRVKLLERQQELQEKLITEQKFYYKSLLKKDEETRKYRHDMNEKLQAIYNISDLVEVRESIHEISGDINRIEGMVKRVTGFDMVDVILYKLSEKYEKEKIEVDWEGKIPAVVKINNSDMISLFSNLLSNAFEAAVQCTGNRFVKVQVSTDGRKLFVALKNSCAGKVTVKNGRIDTSKQDKLNHGYGMQIIREVVKRYDGTLDFSSEENLFEVEIFFSDVHVEQN